MLRVLIPLQLASRDMIWLLKHTLLLGLSVYKMLHDAQHMDRLQCAAELAWLHELAWIVEQSTLLPHDDSQPALPT